MRRRTIYLARLVDTSWRHSARQDGERFTIDLVITVSVSVGRKKNLGSVPGVAVLLLPLRFFETGQRHESQHAKCQLWGSNPRAVACSGS